MKIVEKHLCHGGQQLVLCHDSEVLGCEMRLGLFLPNHSPGEKLPVLYWLSGLTCSEQNFICKSAFQQHAAKHGFAVVSPDTSPRGEHVPRGHSWDIGHGAGFYLDATQEPWSKNYRMFTYITSELPALVEDAYSLNGELRGILGHSMGGHGALLCALKKPELYRSVSALAPICSASHSSFGKNAFPAYLGDNQEAWKNWDVCELLEAGKELPCPILVDQGTADEFLEEGLQTQLLEDLAKEGKISLDLRWREGYDHSFYFISTFLKEHMEYHANKIFNKQI